MKCIGNLVWLLLAANLCENIVRSETAVQGDVRKLVKLYHCSHSSSDQLTGLNVEDTFIMPHHLMTINESTTFRIHRKCPSTNPNCRAEAVCSTETFNVSVRLNVSEDTDFIDGLFTKQGLFRHSNEYFYRNEYCLNGMNSTHIDISVCKAKCGEASLCIPKCCPMEKVMNLDSRTCVATHNNEYWKPLVYQSEDVQVCGEKKNNLRLHYIHYAPLCHKNVTYTLKDYSKHEHKVRFRLLKSGKVILNQPKSKKWDVQNDGEFCLDGIQTFENGTALPLSKADQILFRCFPEIKADTKIAKKAKSWESSKLTFSGVVYFSGIPFLLITVIPRILLWGKQNVHGRTLVSYNFAMLLYYFCQGLENTLTRIYNSQNDRPYSCKLIGVVCHFFAMASFCWLTVINLDIWLAFRHLQNEVEQSGGVKKFILYSCFGWGLPLIAVTIGVSLDIKYGFHGYKADCETEIVIPLYGQKSCYIVEEARAYYLYWPMTALMVINLVIGSATIYCMYDYTKSTTLTLEDDSSQHKQSFYVWTKLFGIMGLVLMVEIIVWNHRAKDDSLSWYFVFTDVLNLFQAIAIFILFTFKRKVIDYPSSNLQRNRRQ